MAFKKKKISQELRKSPAQKCRTAFNKWYIQNVTKDNFSLIPGELVADESQPVAHAAGDAVSVYLCQGQQG